MRKVEAIKYLIIGNSAGGIGAAESIRKVDKAGTITIISDEPYFTYSRPLISEHLAEKWPLERMLFRPADFYERNQIQTLLGHRVVKLNIKEHSVGLEDGSKLTWRKLLLATGGSPIVPDMPGSNLEGVFTFTTLDDARAIDTFLSQYSPRKARAVVIGGGLIGVSVTEALVKRGVEVTIVEMKERLLNTMLDEETSALVEATLKQNGVEIITGRTVSKVSSYLSGEATGVTLDNSQPLPCEMVVVAIGVRPRTELAADTGIKVNRGIVVNRNMATSVADVYACGDAAEAYDFIYEENRLTPIWPNAYLGGRVAGFNMAGRATEYQGGCAMNALKYFGLHIVSAGIVIPPDDSYETISKQHDSISKKVILKDGRIVGMVLTGDIERSGIIYNLMKERVDVSHFKEALVADNFGLVYLPEEIRRAKLAVPPSALTSPATFVEPAAEVLVGE